MLIYKITNVINSKVYIGLTTKTLSARVSSYKSAVKNRKPGRHKILNKMIKYGLDSFEFTILEDNIKCKDYLRSREVYYISKFNCTSEKLGYNISPGGDLASEETLKKRSESLLGKITPQPVKEKIRNSLLGIKHTEERKKNQSIAARNKYKNGYINPRKGRGGKPNVGSFKLGEIAPNKGRVRVIDPLGKTRYIKPENICIL
jgi:group I intron endonuclease